MKTGILTKSLTVTTKENGRGQSECLPSDSIARICKPF